MSIWFGQTRKKSPRQGALGSGSVERPVGACPRNEVLLKGDGQGLHNPLAWDSIPTALKEKFPHWKDSTPPAMMQSQQSEGSQCYALYKSTNSSKQQPDYTFPYVVMENDTLNSIAVKFETTPAELARLNKKPLGLTTTIFTGEVLYVPDNDELDRSLPKSAPPNLTHPNLETLTSSVESENIVRSSSLSYHLPESNTEFEQEGDVMVESGTIHDTNEVFEEVTSTHLVLVSRYISDDQGCIRGRLIVNQTAVIFAPLRNEPLVKEHGSAGFEVMIPLQDIIYAAFTNDVKPPPQISFRGALLDAEENVAPDNNAELMPEISEEMEESRKNVLEISEEVEESRKNVPEISEEVEESRKNVPEISEEVEESRKNVPEISEEVEESRKNVSEISEEVEESRKNVPEISEEVEESRKNVSEISEEVENEEGGLEEDVVEKDKKGGNGTKNDDEQAGSLESRGKYRHTIELEAEVASGSLEAVSGAKVTECELERQTSADEMLAIMGAGSTTKDGTRNYNHSISESSVDTFFPGNVCFLHIRVSHKSHATHTYTPLNHPIGIDIPQKILSPSTFQQVKTLFCFAVAEQRVGDLVRLISRFHPLKSCEIPSTFTWPGDVYEFISNESLMINEDLMFSDNHFKGGESFESWEVYSLKDVPKYRQRIDKMDVEATLPLPNLSEPSSLMEEAHLRALSNNIPSAAVSHDWILIYSTFRDGISLRTLYRNMFLCELPDTPTVLLIRDDQNKLFGAAVTSPLKISEKFYGTGESFLFSFNSSSDIRIYYWSGENNYIVKGSLDGLYIGCGDGHTGLWLDESLLNGTSQECSTFHNRCLASSTEFTCTGVEAWGFS